MTFSKMSIAAAIINIARLVSAQTSLGCTTTYTAVNFLPAFPALVPTTVYLGTATQTSSVDCGICTSLVVTTVTNNPQSDPAAGGHGPVVHPHASTVTVSATTVTDFLCASMTPEEEEEEEEEESEGSGDELGASFAAGEMEEED